MIKTLCIALTVGLLQLCNGVPGNNNQDEPHEYTDVQDVTWASADGVKLTMDIYIPKTGKSEYPVLVIYHGGGWLLNDESIMDDMSEYIASHSEYVVCNVNYRLLTDNGNTTMLNETIEDAFGALLWIKEYIEKYKGNPDKIAVTGDSAGGHLAGMIVTSGHKLESDGFEGESLGFNPTYLPGNKTAEEVAADNGLAVQAAVLNYPALNMYRTALGGFEQESNNFWEMANAEPRGIFGEDINVHDNPEYYKACSPALNIPDASRRKLPPQLCTVGSKDNLVKPESVKNYVEKVRNAGHQIKYWVHEGRPHAFLDSGSNESLGISFEKDAIPALERIITFLDAEL